MLTLEQFPFHGSSMNFLQLSAELEAFVERNEEYDFITDPPSRYSMFCSGVNYRKSELTLGLSSKSYERDEMPVFLQGGYFG